MVSKIMKVLKRVYSILEVLISYFPFVNSIRMTGCKLYRNKAIIIGSAFNVKGEKNIIKFEGGNKLNNCHIFLRGTNNSIIIGSHTKLKDVELWIEDNNNKIIIGDDCSFMGRCHIACTEGTSIIIGNQCLLSSGITFRSGDSHSIIDISSGIRLNPAKNIYVGDHVWIASNVTICKGVNILNDCVIGTGTVVTNDFFDHNSLIAGVPARVIRQNISWTGERI